MPFEDTTFYEARKVMKQGTGSGTGSGFNTKLYTIAASYTATKSTENISHGCAFRGGNIDQSRRKAFGGGAAQAAG